MSRALVAVTPINRTLYNNFDLVVAGASLVFYIENASTTDGAYGSRSELVPPSAVPIANFYSTSGNLLNIAISVITVSKLMELYIDEGTNSGTWMRADSVLVTAQAPQFTRAFRFVCPYVRVTISNAGLQNIALYTLLRASTS